MHPQSEGLKTVFRNDKGAYRAIRCSLLVSHKRAKRQRRQGLFLPYRALPAFPRLWLTAQGCRYCHERTLTRWLSIKTVSRFLSFKRDTLFFLTTGLYQFLAHTAQAFGGNAEVRRYHFQRHALCQVGVGAQEIFVTFFSRKTQ